MSEEKAVYDHTKAYEDDGPMGEKINDLMQLAKTNGCPIMVIAAISADDKATNIAISQNTRNGMMPNTMFAARELLTLEEVHVNVLTHIIDCMKAADANIDHIRSDLQNAAQRIMTEEADTDRAN